MSPTNSNNNISSSSSTASKGGHQPPFDENSKLVSSSGAAVAQNTSFASSTASSKRHHNSWQGTVRDYSNVYRMFFGTNILTQPWSMMVLGVVVGPIATLFVAVLEYRSILSLLRVKNHFNDRDRLVSFGRVGERTIGKCGSWAVEIIVIVCQWLGCIGYATFSGHNFNKISGLDYNWCVIISVAVSLLVSLAQNPFFLAKLSVFTNTVMFTGVIIIFSQLRFGEEAEKRGSIDLWTDPFHTMVGLTSLATSLGGITVSLDVERTMTHSPGRFHKILNRMIVFAVCLLTAIGLLSYAAFRSKTCSVLSLSLDEGPARKAAEAILVVGPAFESVLNSFQMLVIVTDRLKEFPTVFNPQGSTLQFVMLRVITFVTVGAIAIGVPFYGLIASVNGAVGYGALAFIFPAWMELKVIYNMENGIPMTQSSSNNAILGDTDSNTNENNNPANATRSGVHLELESGNLGRGDGDDDNVATENRNVVRNMNTSMQPGNNTNTNNGEDDNETPGAVEEQILAQNEQLHNIDDDENISVDAESIRLAHSETILPSRKYELYAILIFGGAIILAGGFAAVRDIVRKEEGLESQGC